MKLPISILALVFAVPGTDTRAELPTIQSGVPRISVREGSELKRDSWILAPDVKPDVYLADLIDGEPRRITFITDIDSISFVVDLEKSHDFIIQWGEQACHTRITGRRFVPAAQFDQAYQAENRGKILVEIPEVYELVNVAIAMTSFGKQKRNFVYHDSPYYSRVMEWFDAHAAHPFVTSLDSLLTENSGHYARLKMNGNSFLFDENDRIIQSSVYDRTGFPSNRYNALRPYLDRMQSFADASRFRTFYRDNEEVYSSCVAFLSDSADVSGMKRWLDGHFPGSNDFDLYKIVFSPLVSYNQSSTWFESNGFRELQPHVNFPYRADAIRSAELTQMAETISRGNIVFTEINHGYINPEGDKYETRISEATSNRDRWVDSGKGPRYYGGNSAFDEYINWGLVCLRILDYVAENEQEILMQGIVQMMVRGRGFPQFESFNLFLTELYANRAPEATIADLYPDIIEWFDQNNQ